MAYGEIFYQRCNDQTTQTDITIVTQLLAANFVGLPSQSSTSAIITVRGRVDAVYIGHQAAAGNAYSFLAAPVAVTFGGLTTLVKTGDVLTDSDPIAFSWNGTSNILVAVQYAGLQTFQDGPTATGANAYYRFITGDTGTVVKSGYSTLANHNYSVEGVRLAGFATAAPTPTRLIVGDGNSLMVGYSAQAPATDAIPSQMIGMLRYGSTQLNYGVPGAQTSTLITLNSTNGHWIPGALAVLWEVTNDLFENHDPAGAVTRYWAWCDQVSAQGYAVIAGTILPRNDGVYVGFEADRQIANAAIRAGYATHAAALADPGNSSTVIGVPGAYNNTTYFSTDKVHLTDAGYNVAALLFAAAAQEIIDDGGGAGVVVVNQWMEWSRMNPNFYNKGVAITKSDTINFVQGLCSAIYVGGAGDVVAVFQDDTTATFTAVAGEILPIQAKRVNSGSTSASAMVALYQV